jgi:lysophospholipase L1-like esterase
MKVATSPAIPDLQMPCCLPTLNLSNGSDKNSAAWPALPSLNGSSLKLPPPGVDCPINKTTPVLKPQAAKPVTSTKVNRSKLRTSVLFGTSITEEVIGKRLGHRGRRDVINCSESGATIGMISDMVDSFANFAPEAEDIEKVVLCLGTNDIKNATKGVRHLTSPLFGLINKVKRYFPGAVVLVFSTLPMKNMYWFTCENFLNFNVILRNVCRKTDCYYVDCFNNFLSQNKSDYNSALFRDPWHLNKKGLGVLCSILKAVINCNNFSSIIRTEYIGYSNQY